MDPDPRVEDEPPACEPCEYPCVECSYHPNICDSCVTGFELYEIDRTCFEIIEYDWYFLIAAVGIFVFVLFVDCIKRSTDFLHSLLFFFSLLENAVWGYMLWLYFNGKVEGDRSLSIASVGGSVLLTLVFAVVHAKLIMAGASPEYK